MSGAELGLAIFATLDICFKYGKTIVKKYKSFHDAAHEIEERTLAIEVTWIKISQQLEFLKRVWDSLPENYQDLQDRFIRVLERKLQAAVLQISKLEKCATQDSSGAISKRKAGRYIVEVKDSLENAICDLQKWQKDFDPAWFVVLRVGDRTIDTQLVKGPGTEKLSVARSVRDALQKEPQRKISVFLPENKLSLADRSEIPHSSSSFIEIAGQGKLILESADCSSRTDDPTVFAKDVRHLAMMLQLVDANAFHLLRCHGVVRMKEPGTKRILSYNFIFNTPKGCSDPQSLRGHLLSQVSHSLSDKISLAQQLAKSLSYIHVLDIVHKNIRPETVLIFRDDKQSSKLGQSFLLGFEAFRMADGRTLRLGSSVQEEDIYRHPDRQGSNPTAEYTMQHDIYSLGVCLLEIGLWDSFVNSDGSAGLSIENGVRGLKDQYTELAKEKLPNRMGNKYMEVVVSCLTCLDTTNKDFGDPSEFEDEDGILIAVKYIEKILLLLSEISV